MAILRGHGGAMLYTVPRRAKDSCVIELSLYLTTDSWNTATSMAEAPTLAVLVCSGFNVQRSTMIMVFRIYPICGITRRVLVTCGQCDCQDGGKTVAGMTQHSLPVVNPDYMQDI